jgi:hypothetical protein
MRRTLTHSRAPLTVEDVMAAVKRLSPGELRAFTNLFKDWQSQNGHGAAEEAALLTCIQRNSRLTVAVQRRFDRLRNKRQAETLTPSEEVQLQALWQRVEQMTAARLEALGELARRRGTDVRTLMRELGVSENRHVF